jgi:hypothetical protein
MADLDVTPLQRLSRMERDNISALLDVPQTGIEQNSIQRSICVAKWLRIGRCTDRIGIRDPMQTASSGILFVV